MAVADRSICRRVASRLPRSDGGVAAHRSESGKAADDRLRRQRQRDLRRRAAVHAAWVLRASLERRGDNTIDDDYRRGETRRLEADIDQRRHLPSVFRQQGLLSRNHSFAGSALLEPEPRYLQLQAWHIGIS